LALRGVPFRAVRAPLHRRSREVNTLWKQLIASIRPVGTERQRVRLRAQHQPDDLGTWPVYLSGRLVDSDAESAHGGTRARSNRREFQILPRPGMEPGVDRLPCTLEPSVDLSRRSLSCLADQPS